jgi:hypothetical protein
VRSCVLIWGASCPKHARCFRVSASTTCRKAALLARVWVNGCLYRRKSASYTALWLWHWLWLWLWLSPSLWLSGFVRPLPTRCVILKGTARASSAPCSTPLTVPLPAPLGRRASHSASPWLTAQADSASPTSRRSLALSPTHIPLRLPAQTTRCCTAMR